MTRASVREYAGVQRERYLRATRAEKWLLLDEVVAVAQIHRKAAIQLLRRPPRASIVPSRAGRPPCYGPEVAAAAEVLWQASGRIGAHRLHPFMPELLDRLTQWGELAVSPALDKLVRQVSRPTLARLLAPARAQYPPRGATLTRPGSLLKHEIPIRTFTEWNMLRIGNTNDIRRWSPLPWWPPRPRHHDVTCQTRTPPSPGADGTETSSFIQILSSVIVMDSSGGGPIASRPGREAD